MKSLTGSIRKCSLFASAPLAAGLIYLWASPVCAQSEESSAPKGSKKPETVIVTGQRSQQEIDTLVSQFVDQHTATNRKTGQLMRDDAGPLCPLTLGLPQPFNDFVTARVIRVAASIGAQIDAT